MLRRESVRVMVRGPSPGPGRRCAVRGRGCSVRSVCSARRRSSDGEVVEFGEQPLEFGTASALRRPTPLPATCRRRGRRSRWRATPRAPSPRRRRRWRRCAPSAARVRRRPRGVLGVRDALAMPSASACALRREGGGKLCGVGEQGLEGGPVSRRPASRSGSPRCGRCCRARWSARSRCVRSARVWRGWSAVRRRPAPRSNGESALPPLSST